MDLRRLRFAEQIPPASVEDARRLRTLPSSWARGIPESAVDGLLKRAEALANARRAAGDSRAAADLHHAAAMLRRADAVHAQAGRLETLAQLYLALAALRADLVSDEDVLADESAGWLQAGALPTADLSSAHGPAFRETAALRNRAFRQLEAMISRHTRPPSARSRR
jgi:hypothetical protein